MIPDNCIIIRSSSRCIELELTVFMCKMGLSNTAEVLTISPIVVLPLKKILV